MCLMRLYRVVVVRLFGAGSSSGSEFRLLSISTDLTSSLYQWGLGALYLPVSTSSGRHPHLNIVITGLLLVDILLIYGSGTGVLFNWW